MYRRPVKWPDAPTPDSTFALTQTTTIYAYLNLKSSKDYTAMSKNKGKGSRKQKGKGKNVGLVGRQWHVPSVQTTGGEVIAQGTAQRDEDMAPASPEWVAVSPTISPAGGVAPAGEVLEDHTTPVHGPDSGSLASGSIDGNDHGTVSSTNHATAASLPAQAAPDVQQDAGANDNGTPDEMDVDIVLKERKEDAVKGSETPSDMSLSTATMDTPASDVVASEMDIDKVPVTAQEKRTTSSLEPNHNGFDDGMNMESNLPALPPSPPPAAPAPPSDIVEAIPGMHRILDLVSEQGSGGLVDKVIISQDSFGRFVNDVCPGAYQSMTHVNFKALDDLSVRPLGIYGSKCEIVRYLKDLDLISDDIAEALLAGHDDMPAAKALRSGLYLLHNVPAGIVYVIFWPQDTTWNDDALSSVARNRVTFMRYLTKIADQLVVLVPDEYSDSLVFAEEAPAEPSFDMDDGVDRLFTFEVKKTHEEEENVTATDGFKISDLPLGSATTPDDVHIAPELLRPRLVPGETCLGVMETSYQVATTVHHDKNEEFQRTRLVDFIKKSSFRLASSLSESAFEVLCKCGLPALAEDEYRRLVEERKAMEATISNEEKEASDTLRSTILTQNPLLVDALITEAAEVVVKTFSVFGSVDNLLPERSPERSTSVDDTNPPELLKHLCAIYPGVRSLRDEISSDRKLKSIGAKAFTEQKEKLLRLQAESLGQEESTSAPIDDQSSEMDAPGSWTLVAKKASKAISKYVPGPIFSSQGPYNSAPKPPSDTEFLLTLPDFVNKCPELAEETQEAVTIARGLFSSYIHTSANKIAQRIEEIQRSECRNQLQARHKHLRASTMEDSRKTFISATQEQFVRDPDRVFLIEDVRNNTPAYLRSTYESFRLVGIAQSKSEASLNYSIRMLQVTESDKHAMQLNEAHVPSPRTSQSPYSFNLSLRHRILFIQLLNDSRCFLVTRNERGVVSVYLERLLDLEGAVKSSRAKKTLSADKVQGDLLMSFDETKRMLAVCVVDKCQIWPFVFDEHYRNLQGLGEKLELVTWYEPHHVLTHMVFRCGADEELLLVDSTNRARVLSLTTQQIRPASLQLPCRPLLLRSSPDGSCFFSVDVLQDKANLQAFHWASFGSTQGISVPLPSVAADSLEVTTFANRMRCHVVILDINLAAMRSVALQISHKSTEFTFRADERGSRLHSQERKTIHNAIIDCHRDVWTRFPVVPAVRRHTYKSSQRERRSLTFISRSPSERFSAYYSDMIVTFERTTRKPVEDELASVIVSGLTYSAFMKQGTQAISRMRAGEWLVDILCLIPIHIAVARDNRFVPLKDGMSSTEFERALLGATVEQVVDKLSFGWYESIFQSYMATKPVRVVSSMGEQSVGKSFALNHLVDTSFAGSAMRTTEGVWMSVTPTEECLIVALDFEGVHSIERSAQEDSLLVLFNTAISNLVLFRNNFALSRDITTLFQSFQSSATVLDPAANPSLFKSELVIIVKDVVDSDMREITKEFSLKFQQIVQMEQEDNFISRLHGGRLSIIPWPVIESRQFYGLFTTVKKRLDAQPVSHSKAGIFLQKMKTLMAKLKTNDWGALDQNLATHRALHLQSILPLALQFGSSEVEPELEPLKDIDNGVALTLPHGSAIVFYLPVSDGSAETASGEQCLGSLRESWDQFHSRDGTGDREWTDRLDRYLESCANNRIADVQHWLDVNTARFNSDAATFQPLRRQFEALAVALRAGVQLCKLQCAECQLFCVQTRHHSGSHDCGTSHHCANPCAFPDEHPDETSTCGLPAGHSGQHICDITLHLCGQPCRLSGKGGCLGRCAQIVNHLEEEHLCPATSHECGMPCSLKNIRRPDGSIFSCPEVCHISSEQPHTDHVCQQQCCPLFCQLCRRLCSEANHLHGLDEHASHLCGQEHDCTALCQSPGICRIETAPQSVEATFTGRHETFQYTKYMQESKRLQCVVTIPMGALRHEGSHKHSLDPKAFHFCETRCKNCGYFCTLPLGHSQQEHETSHGSMSRTNWAVEGPDGSIIEVNGRKFGSNDDGAPLLCSMICQQMGRHVHVDFCRALPNQPCSGNGLTHCAARMVPEPEKPKDFVSHELSWRRTGFKDPYPHEDREAFAKCDAMCTGREHQADANGPAQPSHCMLPIFHAPLTLADAPPGGVGYISGDGHHFGCRNPALLQQAFHVIFVIDRSGSMGGTDRRPLRDTPVSARIAARHNNRIGAVYSSLHAFWTARHAVANGATNRRDAYSVILFDSYQTEIVTNDFASSPEQLLDLVLAHGRAGGTNYAGALEATRAVMERHWSTERAPVVIFLSDGECALDDSVTRDLSRRAIALGRALSFHAVSFGPYNNVLRRMADIAAEVQRNAPADPMNPAVPSSYVEALDSVRLAETFLGIAHSLTKPRGGLMHR